MKGMVLACGMGTRLMPLTKITNKHLLPVYDRPMVYCSIRALVNAGVEEVMFVTSGNSAGDFLWLLENGRGFVLKRIHHACQEGSGVSLRRWLGRGPCRGRSGLRHPQRQPVR